MIARLVMSGISTHSQKAPLYRGLMNPGSSMDALLNGFRQAFFDHTNVFLSSRAFFLCDKVKNNMKASNDKANKLAIPKYANKWAQEHDEVMMSRSK